MTKAMNMSHSARYLVLVLMLALGIATGCIRDSDEEFGGRGEYLSIGAYQPQLVDKVVYTTIQGQNYVITPQQEGTTIAAVRTRAVNLKSTQVILSVDEDAALLTTADGAGYRPINPAVQAVETSEQPPKDNPYGSHIWGQFQLIQNFEIAGWFFFEVPEDSEFLAFAWDDVELVRVLYPP